MVDLQGQYLRIKQEIDRAIQQVLNDADFIQGKAVQEFEDALSRYIGCKAISCANGTDALQLAMMALEFKPGDEVIVPVHTYVATAEVIALLRLTPLFVDVEPDVFTIDIAKIEERISKKTVAIVPVHLYGQCANMNPILALAKKHNLHVIEDAAQSLGAEYFLSPGKAVKAGAMGVIGTTSFFPSKNLGAYGDGGAFFTNDVELADKIRMMANHGQKKKYYHDVIGCNSRLDTLQAAILNVKLRHLNEYAFKRKAVADFYDKNLCDVSGIVTPARATYSSHVFHQYTIQSEKRDQLKEYLQSKGIPSMIYYPVPLHLQKAYQNASFPRGTFPVSERLSATVLSLPIHTEMDEEQLSYICDSIRAF